MPPISRLLRPSPYFNRRISRILRMDNLFRATVFLLAQESLARLEEAAPYIRSSSTPPHPLGSSGPSSPAGHNDGATGWTKCVGIDGHFASESVDEMNRNQWTASVGMSGRNASESARGRQAAVGRLHRAVPPTLLEEHLRIKGRTTWYERLDEMQRHLDGYLEALHTRRPHLRPRDAGQDALLGVQGRGSAEAAHPEAPAGKEVTDRRVELTSARPGVR